MLQILLILWCCPKHVILITHIQCTVDASLLERFPDGVWGDAVPGMLDPFHKTFNGGNPHVSRCDVGFFTTEQPFIIFFLQMYLEWPVLRYIGRMKLRCTATWDESNVNVKVFSGVFLNSLSTMSTERVQHQQPSFPSVSSPNPVKP